jgi:hypothetical protein
MVKMQQRQFSDEPMEAINFRVPESLYKQIKKHRQKSPRQEEKKSYLRGGAKYYRPFQN